MAHIPDKDALNEHPSTYMVQDRSNEEELLRVDVQDRMYTTCMGGVLPEQIDPKRFQRVLDVGCGSGWWLIETARSYPEIELLAGIDISGRMITYAREQAEKTDVSNRMQFQTGDALRMLEFPNQFFDLVNVRFGMSWLRKWDWPKLLREFQRVTRPNGVIRITEASISTTTSPATRQLLDLTFQAMCQAGHFFTPERDGVIRHLADKMRQHGIERVQTKTYTVALHADPQTKNAFAEDMRRGFRTIKPFLQKWTRLPADYEETYQQMIQETQQPDFQASHIVQTTWGVWEPITSGTMFR